MADFSSWTVLRTALRNTLANSPEALLTESYSLPGGGSMRFRSLKQVMEFLEFVDSQIANEDGQEGSEAVVEFV